MQVNKEQAEMLNEAISNWQESGLVLPDQADSLRKSLTVRKFDWKQVTVYAFIVAMVCAVLSVIVLLADKPLRAIIEKFTQLTDFGISSILSLFTLLVIWYAKIRLSKYPETPFSNNSFLLFGAFLSLASIAYWAKTIQVFENNHAMIFLLGAAIYAGLALMFRSQTLWVLAVLMLAMAYGTFTSLSFSSQEKFLGMNLPLRFIPFSVLLLAFLAVFNKIKTISHFLKIHYITGLLLFYTALWLVTIFGNYTDWERWNEIRQIQFLVWSIVLFVVAAAGMYFGLKRSDFVLGNTSLVFFILNLVTRYFEYCWEPLHKSVFFMLLALVFWFIGSRAEKLWNLKFLDSQ
jgi:hypothetical protein